MAEKISWRNPLAWPPPVLGAGLVGFAGLSAKGGWGSDYTGLFLLFGALLIVTPLVVHRLQSVSHKDGAWELVFSDAEKAGGKKTARKLEGAGLLDLASHYQFVHSELDADEFRAAKVHLQDTLVERAAQLALKTSLDAEEVRNLVEHGAPVMKVLALGLMKGNPRLASVEALAFAISNSATANEQYHALLIARDSWPRLEEAQRRSLIDVIEKDRHIPEDSDRKGVAAEILSLSHGV